MCVGDGILDSPPACRLSASLRAEPPGGQARKGEYLHGLAGIDATSNATLQSRRMKRIMAILLTCWSLLIGPSLCTGAILAHPCECGTTCQECPPQPDTGQGPCHGDPCRTAVADKPSTGRDGEPSAAVSSSPITPDLAIIPNALVAMPTTNATGRLPDMIQRCRHPLATGGVLPLLI